MLIAIDTEFDEVTKIPFIVTLSDGKTSTLLYPDRKKDYWILKKICENPGVKKIFHAATVDIYALHRIGIDVVPPYHDTFIMSSIIDENYSSRKLKDLAKRYLHEPCEEQRELNKVKLKYKRKYGKNFRWSMIPKEVIEPYAVKDAEYTYNLYKYFKPKLKNCQDLYKMELNLIPVILDMQKRGHRINREFCKNEIQKLNSMYAEHYSNLIHFNRKVFNLQSPKDLRNLIKKTGVKITSFTEKTNQINTSKDVLEPLAEKNEVIKDIVICRAASKQVNTYYEPLYNRYTSDTDDIAHFSFYQSGTRTGRFSAELIQTIPKEKKTGYVDNNVRHAFIPRDGYVNFYIDYDQIEMRLFAHFTDNKRLIQAIKKGFDCHEATAIDVFGKEKYSSDPKTYRRYAKYINFGIIYGMGSKRLAQQLGIPFHQANVYLSVYDQKYKIKSFNSRMTSLLYRQGYIKLDWIGREYKIPKRLAYKCVNTVIQGSAAYIIKLAMKRCHDYIKEIPGVNLLLQVHDELVFEIHKSHNISVIVENLVSLIEDHTTFRVPITASVEYSEISWNRKKPWKRY
jgi:DNA polymerase-1